MNDAASCSDTSNLEAVAELLNQFREAGTFKTLLEGAAHIQSASPPAFAGDSCTAPTKSQSSSSEAGGSNATFSIWSKSDASRIFGSGQAFVAVRASYWSG